MHKESIKLLLVDDDAGDRKIVKLALDQSSSAADFNIETAENLSQATEFLKNKDYDVVLLDLGLPDSGGVNTVQKAHEANPNVPIIVLTGLVDEETGLQAIEKGAEDYLIKGKSLEHALVRIIRYAIERKKVERKLKDAIEAKSQFMSMVSHELRVPLTSIKESISIVLEGLTGKITKEQENCLGIAKRNVDRLNRLINDLLDFHKLEAGRMNFNMQDSNVNEIVKEVYDTMLPVAKEKKINLVLEIDSNLPRVSFDKDKINQVLSNLVNNAIKFTKEGSVTITTSREEDTIRVSVSDTGCGIKKEDLPKLFHEFEQLETVGIEKVNGTGLGLAISKEIVTKHNGEIWAESEAGKGSTFSFTLPTQEMDITKDKELEAQIAGRQ
ncbi:MAG: response regulator [Sedimentisphaerales bacterium]|nr:response regulator [Sedimentisphaerales bacterium]